MNLIDRSATQWPSRRALLRSSALATCIITAACSGGSGGGGVNTMPAPAPAPSPTPTPPPAPAPTPTPSPPATGFDTAEYRATVGAVSMNALAAYQRNATGAGISIGVIDSGIDAGSEEFPGRISAASVSTSGQSSTDDVDGHGTAVGFTIAGRRNGAGTHGVAFDSTLIVIRADTPGSCAATGEDEGCTFNDSAIARGIDVATTNGARVINMSLGGSAPNATVIEAINRATAAGVIIIISAGNDFDDDPVSAANPDGFAQVANSAAARGLVIIAGSVGESGTISSFSNRAGTSAAYYLTAVGERVRAPCENTNVCLWSGTSFSAPQISGAVALLAQAFPALTGAQIVSILFSSARDAGAPGSDPVYGGGILDLTRAFAPLGSTSVAGTSGRTSLTANGTLSAPMGDAAQGELGAVILDGYKRAFAIDLARTINRNGPARTFANTLQTRTRGFSAVVKDMTVSVTLAPVVGGIAVERSLLSPSDARSAKAIAGIVTQRIGGTMQVAFGFAQSGSALTAQLAGRSDPAFLIARDPANGQGFDSTIKASGALRQTFGDWGVTAALESGDVLAGGDPDALIGLRGRYRRSPYDRVGLALDRRIGGLRLGLGAARLAEHDTLLGALFGSGLGATRATSWFLDGAARVDAGSGWSIGGSLRQGWTFADVRSGLNGGGMIRTNGFSADIGKLGIWGRSDTAGLRIAQPLRVASGAVELRLPVGYDYATGGANAWATQRLNLAPTGREIDVEAHYDLRVFGGVVQTNLFLRRNPGNFATLPDDIGGAVRYSIAF